MGCTEFHVVFETKIKKVESSLMIAVNRLIGSVMHAIALKLGYTKWDTKEHTGKRAENCEFTLVSIQYS